MYEQYTDKQIVEMLKPKLEKLGWGIVVNNDLYSSTIKMIATIYRSAYIRGQLGRSFIIGEKKTKELVNPFKVGDKVKFLGISIEDKEALSNRWFYPPVNTVGEIVESDLVFCLVQWPKGTTSGDGIWRCRHNYLEKVTEHWVPVNDDGSNVKKDDYVRYTEEHKHKNSPEYYPAKDMIGKVIKVCSNQTCFVQWPKGSTSGNDKWYATWFDLEVLVCE